MYRRVMNTCFAVGLLSFSMLAFGQQKERQTSSSRDGGPVATAPVQKFGVVWEGKITRSALPKDEQGWKWLREQGVSTVVNFRQDNDVDYKRLGFDSFLWLPIKGGNPPTAEQVDTFLRFVQDPDNQPVHIHCAEGKSRTGMMIALLRYAVDGWPIEKALEEARLYKRGEDLAPGQVEWLRKWADAHKPGSRKLN